MDRIRAKAKRDKEHPEDRRVLRVLYNDTPFHPEGATVCEEYMHAFADSLNPVERDKYEKSWPVLEHNEVVLANLSMKRVKRIMEDLLQCCTGRRMKVNLEGLEGGDDISVSFNYFYYTKYFNRVYALQYLLTHHPAP